MFLQDQKIMSQARIQPKKIQKLVRSLLKTKNDKSSCLSENNIKDYTRYENNIISLYQV